VLVAVSKMQSAETVAAAYAAGIRLFGENRTEEAAGKTEAVARLVSPEAAPDWHMIGHLQSRKAADALAWATMIHSVDSVKLAQRLSRLCQEQQREVPILLEVNVSGEASKYGFFPGELIQAVALITALPGLSVQGLMTMAPMAPDPELARPVFAGLRTLRNELTQHAGASARASWHLSMGMTDDFEVAIEEGATIVRIGRAIFG
jgi:PLP dependent protein